MNYELAKDEIKSAELHRSFEFRIENEKYEL